MPKITSLIILLLIAFVVSLSFTVRQGTAQANPSVILQTNQGDIQITLYCDKTPKTCENFIGHVKNGYYNGLKFHRVIKNFMIQGGDPTGTGTGGESIWGGKFKDEFHPSLTFSKAGILAMANAGPNTNGSQFFITAAPTPWLNNRHTIFGEVVSGITVVKTIENVRTSRGDRPVAEQTIINAYVME